MFKKKKEKFSQMIAFDCFYAPAIFRIGKETCICVMRVAWVKSRGKGFSGSQSPDMMSE